MWDLRYSQCFGDVVGPSWYVGNCALCIMGSLNVCSGESSTRTLFMRVMETFDDDDDDDFWETFDIEILLSQIIIFCTACSVDRAFGILFRKNCSIYRFYHILLILTFYTLQIFLRSCFICSECRVISISTLHFTHRTTEWVLPFWAYPISYIHIYFIYSTVFYYI